MLLWEFCVLLSIQYLSDMKTPNDAGLDLLCESDFYLQTFDPHFPSLKATNFRHAYQLSSVTH